MADETDPVAKIGNVSGVINRALGRGTGPTVPKPGPTDEYGLTEGSTESQDLQRIQDESQADLQHLGDLRSQRMGQAQGLDDGTPKGIAAANRGRAQAERKYDAGVANVDARARNRIAAGGFQDMAEANNEAARDYAVSGLGGILDRQDAKMKDASLGADAYAAALGATFAATIGNALPVLYQGALGIMDGRPMGIAGTVVSMASVGLKPLIDGLNFPGGVMGALKEGADLRIAAEAEYAKQGLKDRDLRSQGFQDFTDAVRQSFDNLDRDRRDRNPNMPSKGHYAIEDMTAEELQIHVNDLSKALEEAEFNYANASSEAERKRWDTARRFLVTYLDGIESRAKTLSRESKEMSRDAREAAKLTGAALKLERDAQEAQKRKDEADLRAFQSSYPALGGITNMDMLKRVRARCTDPATGVFDLDPTKLAYSDMQEIRRILESDLEAMKANGIGPGDPRYNAVDAAFNRFQTFVNNKNAAHDAMMQAIKAQAEADDVQVYQDWMSGKPVPGIPGLPAPNFRLRKQMEVRGVINGTKLADELNRMNPATHPGYLDDFGMFHDQEDFHKYQMSVSREAARLAPPKGSPGSRAWNVADAEDKFTSCVKGFRDCERLIMDNDNGTVPPDRIAVAKDELNKFKIRLMNANTPKAKRDAYAMLSVTRLRIEAALGKNVTGKDVSRHPQAFPIGNGAAAAPMSPNSVAAIHKDSANGLRVAVNSVISKPPDDGTRLLAENIKRYIDDYDADYADALKKHSKGKITDDELRDAAILRDTQICALLSTEPVAALAESSRTVKAVKSRAERMSGADFSGVNDPANVEHRLQVLSVLKPSERKAFVLRARLQLDAIANAAGVTTDELIDDTLGGARTGNPVVDCILMMDVLDASSSPTPPKRTVPTKRGHVSRVPKSARTTAADQILKEYNKIDTTVTGMPDWLDVVGSYAMAKSASSVKKYKAINLVGDREGGAIPDLEIASDDVIVDRLRRLARTQPEYRYICRKAGLDPDDIHSVDEFLLKPASVIESDYNIHDPAVIKAIGRFQATWMRSFPIYRTMWDEADKYRRRHAKRGPRRSKHQEGIEDDIIAENRVDTILSEGKGFRDPRLDRDPLGLLPTLNDMMRSPRILYGDGFVPSADGRTMNLERLGDTKLKRWYETMQSIIGDETPEQFAEMKARAALTLFRGALATYQPRDDKEGIWAKTRDSMIQGIDGALNGDMESIISFWNGMMDNQDKMPYRLWNRVMVRGRAGYSVKGAEVRNTLGNALTMYEAARRYKDIPEGYSEGDVNRYRKRTPGLGSGRAAAHVRFRARQLFDPKDDVDKSRLAELNDMINAHGTEDRVWMYLVIKDALDERKEGVPNTELKSETFKKLTAGPSAYDEYDRVTAELSDPDSLLKRPVKDVKAEEREARKGNRTIDKVKNQAEAEEKAKKKRTRSSAAAPKKPAAPREKPVRLSKRDKQVMDAMLLQMQGIHSGADMTNEDEAAMRMEALSRMIKPRAVFDENGKRIAEKSRPRLDEFTTDELYYIMDKIMGDEFSPDKRLDILSKIYESRYTGGRNGIMSTKDLYDLFGYDKAKMLDEDGNLSASFLSSLGKRDAAKARWFHETVNNAKREFDERAGDPDRMKDVFLHRQKDGGKDRYGGVNIPIADELHRRWVKTNPYRVKTEAEEEPKEEPAAEPPKEELKS